MSKHEKNVRAVLLVVFAFVASCTPLHCAACACIAKAGTGAAATKGVIAAAAIKGAATKGAIVMVTGAGSSAAKAKCVLILSKLKMHYNYYLIADATETFVVDGDSRKLLALLADGTIKETIDLTSAEFKAIDYHKSITIRDEKGRETDVKVQFR